MKDLESRFEELRQYNRKFNESRDEVTREDTSIFIDATRHDIKELVANKMYDKLTILLNNTREKFGIQKGRPIDPLTLLALGGGVFHVNFVCLLITFLVLGRLPPNLVNFHNWILAKFSISKIKNRRFLVAMVTNLSRVVFCQNQ